MIETRLTALDPGRWRLGGALDFTTVMPLAAEGDALFKASAGRGLKRLEIDLSGVEQANSAGLALLLEWLEMAQSRGLRLTYRHLPVSLERIAAFSNLTDLLPRAD